jgi:protein-ribulosamine 3-kinase
MKLSSQQKSKIEEITKSGIESILPVSGGCISEALKLELDSGKIFFLKLNNSNPGDMFIKEAHGLNELYKANTIRIPKVIHFESSFILIEFIRQNKKAENFYEEFGRKFAELHKFTGENFGFYEDNYIGSNVQENIPDKNEKNNWIEFYFNKRILFQLKLAEKNGFATKELITKINSIESKIGNILSGSEEQPSLLHGDLWSGNFIADENGNASLIDPAVYYGHREADLAMTKLFGGFNSEFYHSYNEYFPLPAGYDYRENIYKLYHILNHLNLFGRGYYSQALALLNFYL